MAPLKCDSFVRHAIIIPLIAFTFVSCLFVAKIATANGKPNIIIILADDMGYSDLGCYGSEIETPHIDQLANNGLRFTQFYNTARCCPTRAALLTGLYQHQAGIGHMVGNYGVPSYQGFLNDQCVTIAEALKPAGYKTLISGKWHVGSAKGQWPLDRGFDRYFGTPTGGGVYFKSTLKIRNTVFFVEDNARVEVEDDFYVTDDFTTYAMKFIGEAVEEKKPFFLYLPHIAPHWPLQAKPKDIEKYQGKYKAGWDVIREKRYQKQLEMGIVNKGWKLSPRDPAAKPWNEENAAKQKDLAYRMSVYAAQVDSIDQNVGRLVDQLKELKILENTLILICSDNGCSAEGGPGGFSRGTKGAKIGTGESYASVGLEWANVSDTPYRKFKMDTFEGGIATPLIAHWPKGISVKGKLNHQPGHVIDLMPTCLEVAEASYPTEYKGKKITPVEGTSLSPAFNGKDFTEKPLFWEHQGNRAVRSGKWKLVAGHKKAWELYNLEADRTEHSNLASQHPDKVQELTSLWKEWSKKAGVLPYPVKRKQVDKQNMKKKNAPKNSVKAEK